MNVSECKYDFMNVRRYIRLGGLDGTYIKVNVSATNRPWYLTRKGEIATNMLAVCSPNGEFIFVMPGWEGPTVDSRVLKDAISRPTGLKVPKGIGFFYYICCVQKQTYQWINHMYTVFRLLLTMWCWINAEGFLAPYRGTLLPFRMGWCWKCTYYSA